MIFQASLARAVADGRKTQTRRPVRSDKPCRYKVGHDYAVQPGRGKEQITRLKVLEVREEPVGAITHPDAKAEGFRNVAAFKVAWVQIHDKVWSERYPDVPELDYIEQFDKRHAHKLVHVITFTTTVDTPRFLAQPGPHQGDYTEQRHRAIDDLEVVDERTLARYAKTAEAFCIGRQLARKKEREAEKAARGRSMRLAPSERRAA